MKPLVALPQLTAGLLQALGSRSRRRGVNQGGRAAGVEPAGNALDFVTRRNGDLDAARAWAVARTFGSVSVAPVLPLCGQYWPEANRAWPSATVRQRPQKATAVHSRPLKSVSADKGVI